MKSIDCPYPIEKPVKFSMEDFLMYLLDNHESFIRDAKGVRAAVRIEAAVKAEPKEKTENGYAIALDDADVEMLHNAAENPGPAGYPMVMGTLESGDSVRISLSRHCIGFIDALKKANE